MKGSHGTGSEIRIYPDEDAYEKSANGLASCALIPIGTFTLKEEDPDFIEQPTILFTGRITSAVDKMVYRS